MIGKDQLNNCRATSMSEASSTGRKGFIKRELKELLVIVLYLAISFLLLATFKSLILIQLGINDFAHAYLVAVVEALALAKIVLLAQKLPILNKAEQKSLAWSALFNAAILAVIVYLANEAEERIFARHVAEATVKHQFIMMITHLLAFVIVFYVLFLWRGLDRALGPGKLLKLFTGSTEPSSSAGAASEYHASLSGVD